MTKFRREGEDCRAAHRGRKPGRSEEEKAAAAADTLHEPAAAGARGHISAEPVPGHEHARGDRRVDQFDRGASPGKRRNYKQYNTQYSNYTTEL